MISSLLHQVEQINIQKALSGYKTGEGKLEGVLNTGQEGTEQRGGGLVMRNTWGGEYESMT